MAFHAKLSPSSSHRWMNCAGSVALIGDEDQGQAGIEAMRGTAAHKVIEQMLQRNERDASIYHNFQIVVHEPGTEETKIAPPGEPIGIIDGWFLFICDDKMVAGVQMMIDEVQRTLDECFDPVLHTERFLDMSWLDSRLGGTADVTIVDVDWIFLKDYKNGRIIVEVEDNEQMMNYAVGLLHEHPEARGVTVNLVQPNAYHEDGCIREQTFTADRLKLFEIQMKQAADATSKPNAPRRTGEWCTYCPAKTRCPEFNDMAKTEAGMDFASDPIDAPPASFDGSFAIDDGGESYRAELARKRKWVPVILAWAKDINKAVFAELMNGRDVPGAKLVAGKSNRKFPDKDATVAALVEVGIPEESLYTEPELKSPAQIEKIRPLPEGMKPAKLKALVGTLAVKPEGKISIANADDPRPALDPAAAAISAFAEDSDDQEGDFT